MDITNQKVQELIAACVIHGLNEMPQQAYVLATVEHETGGTFDPIHEVGSYSYFEKRYGLRKDLGNRTVKDGSKFHGRGYVQITGRRNYTKFSDILGLPLVDEPDLALLPEVAATILCYGFKHGSFTGKKLEDYVRPGKVDYIGARRCINGTDRAARIAGLAYRWLKQLREQA